ncbi:MAG: TlpA disulfide reductase family protein [Bacteroidota bacterium]
MKDNLLFSLVLVCLMMTCEKPRQTSTPLLTKSGSIESIRQVKLVDLDGRPINWDKYKNKVVFINFWATWCGPCIKEMPSIEKVKETFSNDDIIFLLATEESENKINTFREKYDFDLLYVRQQTLLNELDIVGLPTTIIFDKKGEIAFRETNMRIWNSDESIKILREVIQRP